MGILRRMVCPRLQFLWVVELEFFDDMNVDNGHENDIIYYI